jgi:ketol-acid reductoisomerase
MATIYYDNDCDMKWLKGKTVAIVGYGNQGRAHALNLRDSGVNVIVGARDGGKAIQSALADRFETLTISGAAERADVIAIMLPDEHVAAVFNNEIKAAIEQNKKERIFVFAHGFTVTYKTIEFPANCDIVLVAPTGPGRQVRSLYEDGLGLPALVAVEQDHSGNAFSVALAYARGIGSSRAGAIKTTFTEETTTDLFCEQAVLCGGMPELIKASFDTLVARGYQPELAYISCLKEVKLIADLLFNLGIDGMRSSISNTARYGSVIAGPTIIDNDARTKIAGLLDNIEDGTFASAFINETASGSPATRAYSAEEENSTIARTGKELKETLRF